MEVTGIENLPLDCPVIFACNHPNAFLDSIVMTTCAKRLLHYTARGDIFKSKISSFLLRYIQILPVYRREEGKEHLHKNDETFSYCLEVFKKNGALVIFSEGGSENKWDLRPLRKGTARLAFEAWNNSEIADKLKVVPVAIHYSSWLKMCPIVHVEFIQHIEKKSFSDCNESGVFNKQFNEQLKNALSEKCIVVDKNCNTALQNRLIGYLLKNTLNGTGNIKTLQEKYILSGSKTFKSNYEELANFLIKENIKYDKKPPRGGMKIITLISSYLLFAIACIYNFIPYCISKLIVWRATKGNDFYDSLLYCVLMLVYPIYLIILFCFINSHVGFWTAIGNVFLATFSAYFYEDSKRGIQSILKKSKLIKVHQMLIPLFETSNG